MGIKSQLAGVRSCHPVAQDLSATSSPGAAFGMCFHHAIDGEDRAKRNGDCRGFAEVLANLCYENR